MDDVYEAPTERTGSVNVTGITIASLLIPGLGQLILGQVGKAMSFFALGLVLFLIFPPLIMFIDLYGAWDAYKESNRINADIDKDLEASALLAETQIAPEDMVSQITKLNLLVTGGVLTPEEFSDRKAKILELLEIKQPIGSAEDFLLPLIPLVQSGVLTADELTKIKSLLLIKY